MNWWVNQARNKQTNKKFMEKKEWQKEREREGELEKELFFTSSANCIERYDYWIVLRKGKKAKAKFHGLYPNDIINISS